MTPPNTSPLVQHRCRNIGVLMAIRSETEGEEEWRARRDVGAPSSDSKGTRRLPLSLLTARARSNAGPRRLAFERGALRKRQTAPCWLSLDRNSGEVLRVHPVILPVKARHSGVASRSHLLSLSLSSYCLLSETTRLFSGPCSRQGECICGRNALT